MPNKNAVMLASVLALTSCASAPTPPVEVSRPPPPVPAALKDKPALTETPLNERIENSLRKFEDSLTKARR